MTSSTVFTSNRSQAVRLPKAVAFPEGVHQVDILKLGRSRVIVPRLKSMGYDVTFREFDGRHELPPAVAQEAMQWLAAK